MNNCSICGSEFKTIPAGVSKKTGKPYNSFVACSKMGCTGKPNMAGNAPEANNTDEQPDWNEINKTKTDSMTELNAKKGSAEIVSAMIACGRLDPKDWKIQFIEVSNAIYNHKCVPFD